ncbi:MAG: diguanylate cyclase, partial [Chromatiales bacterium]|nr:diguanylate cyclase [Chromatiales bacterium]
MTRERLLAAQELALVGDWSWCLQSDSVACSDQVFRVCGVVPGTFVPTPNDSLQFIHPEDRRTVVKALRSARRCGEPNTVEYRLIRPDGSERRVLQQTVARLDERGQVIMLSGTIQDVTERQELSNRLEKLSEHIPGCIYQFQLGSNGASHFPYASKGMEETYGINPELVSDDASPVFATLHHEDVLRVKREIHQSGQELGIWRDEYRVQHPEKGEIWVEGHATPERLPDGSTLWHGYAWDITERKCREHQIRQLALFDPLTGLANRWLLKERIDHALATARRNAHYGAVLMLDLDNFKTLNDTQGHSIGDALLVEVGKRLQNCVRASDTIARLGGDEFVAVLEQLG